jgi:hypothetical protein
MTTSAREENYSLRWNNHQSHILESFDALLQQNSLVDVTLVCADRSLRAHKVVLSACSPFFERVFNDTPCKHPTIVLKDYRGWLVQAIVDFMYRGEIAVPQDRLNQLIQAAESLQIRGLVTAVPTAVESGDRDSPMPRRKQARPRRRSGELADLQPQDLSNGAAAAAAMKCEDTEDEEDDDEPELHALAKRARQNGSNDCNGLDDDHHINDHDDDDDDDDGEIDDDDDDDLGEEKENQPGDVELPQDLCTKRSDEPDASDKNNNNNNNSGSGAKQQQRPQQQQQPPGPHDFHERFILSLKDLRHLNRYRQGPPGHPFNDLLSHLPLSPPPSSFPMPPIEGSAKDAPMKVESEHSDEPDIEQQQQQPHPHHLPPHKLPNHMGMPPFPPPPPFQHGPHPPHSPLPFPPMPSVSALTLTPPHSEFNRRMPFDPSSRCLTDDLAFAVFGLDSPLGLFPPGMDPSKMYSPLMDLPDHHHHHGHRGGGHPDGPFLKKKRK